MENNSLMTDSQCTCGECYRCKVEKLYQESDESMRRLMDGNLDLTEKQQERFISFVIDRTTLTDKEKYIPFTCFENEDSMKYVIQKTTGSYCPECDELLYLLTHEFATQGSLSFYICFECKFVSVVGGGRVKEVCYDTK